MSHSGHTRHLPTLPPFSHFPSFPFITHQHLRDELALHARKQCQEAMGAFAECAKQNGMLVVFKCRSLNKASTQTRGILCVYVCMPVWL